MTSLQSQLAAAAEAYAHEASMGVHEDCVNDFTAGANHALKLVAEREEMAKVRESLSGLHNYAVNTLEDRTAACTEGAGWSLLGQMATQVATDTHYAIKALDKLLAEMRGGE